MASVMNELQQLLQAAGQPELADWIARQPVEKAERLRTQAASVDWSQVQKLVHEARSTAPADFTESIRRAQPPEPLVRQPRNDSDRKAWADARKAGEDWLRQGRVAVVLVAGGQGTRLGFPKPKGLWPVGALSKKSLFQLFAEQLRARQQRYQVRIPYAIMTSDATHADTVEFFEAQSDFGLDRADVRFFCQANMPAVDAATGAALLADAENLALSPDGHGGLLAAMKRSGLLDEFAGRGIQTLFYHQVDNPTTPVCDPALIGWHRLHDADVSTKVVAKRDAAERMGVLASIDGASRIIEYSDLPANLAEETTADGELKLWAGNTAIHVFQREFLELAQADERALPFHIARKSVPHWTPESGICTPEKPNALKFERFIFDILPWARCSLVVEGDRAREFNPIKNQSGNDSPETTARAMHTLAREWLDVAGASADPGVLLEISPLVALEPEDLRRVVTPGTVFRQDTYLDTPADHAGSTSRPS